MARSKHPVELKLTILQLLKEGCHSLSELSKQFMVSTKTIQIWQMKYEANGEEGLREGCLKNVQ